MEFFKLMDISHKYLEILNPISSEKILAVGDVLELVPGNRVIDFGCGNGTLLVLWAEKYGISGTGVDISQYFIEKARNKIKERKLDKRIDIVLANGNEYTTDDHNYDAALCIGATFIWGGFRQTIRAMKDFVKPGGKLVIGEVYWLKEGIPQEYFDETGSEVATYEHELLKLSGEEGYDIEYIVRASLDDWDRYNTGRWHCLVRWIDENPRHPDRQEIIDHLHTQQEKYLKYEREYLGWAIYVLSPMTY